MFIKIPIRYFNVNLNLSDWHNLHSLQQIHDVDITRGSIHKCIILLCKV